MKRTIFSTLFVLAVLFLSAHPPVKLQASFDIDSFGLTLEYSHRVRSAEDHYIKNIVVFLNNTEIISQVLTLQENEEGGKVCYTIPDAKAGDVIEIEAECNKGGTKTTSIAIPKGEQK
jgi:hypothetical protein